MINRAAANRYAKALADVAFETGVHERVAAELNTFGKLLAEHAELCEALNNPAIPLHLRKGILKELARRIRLEKITENFLMLVLERSRLRLLPYICESYSKLVDERLGIVSAQVTTAVALDPEDRELLRARLEQVTGRQVKLGFTVDPEIVGGIIVRIDSTVYDGSIKRQLSEIKHRIASEE